MRKRTFLYLFALVSQIVFKDNCHIGRSAVPVVLVWPLQNTALGNPERKNSSNEQKSNIHINYFRFSTYKRHIVQEI
jgi:hypothetical protein